MCNFCRKRQQMAVPAWPGTNSARGQQRHADGRVLTDTLLLTCHFLFGQKQASLQTPRSGGLWALLLGRDLFTQPRDKVGLLVHPGATITASTFPSRAPPPPPNHPPFNLLLLTPTRHPGQDGAGGGGPGCSVASVRGASGASVLGELARASLGAP